MTRLPLLPDIPHPSTRDRCTAVVLWFWFQAGSLVAARRAWAQAEGGGRSLLDELWQRLAEIQALANNPVVLQYAAYAVGAIVVLWLLGRLPRLLRPAGGGA
ncbi:MAG: hypothetical protein AAB253_09330, partial [candidate division NC10 bacterium]